MKKSKSIKAFTMIELLIAIVCAAMLMTAVAVAFDASVKNFSENEKIYQSTNTARQALQRLTATIRTANAIKLPGEEASNLCSMITSDGGDITYDYRSGDKALYLVNNITGNTYLLCDNVTLMTFTKTTDVVNSITVVKDIRIVMEVTVGGQPKTFKAAAVVRRNLE